MTFDPAQLLPYPQDPSQAPATPAPPHGFVHPSQPVPDPAQQAPPQVQQAPTPTPVPPAPPQPPTPQPPAAPPPPQQPPPMPPPQAPPAPTQPPQAQYAQPPQGWAPAPPQPPAYAPPVAPPGFYPPAQAAPPAPYTPPQGVAIPGMGVPTVHANVQHGAFGDDDIKTGDFDAYKARAKHVDRIGILAPRSLVWGRCHYIQEKGYFVCMSTFAKEGGQEVPTRLAPCCQKFGLPKKRFVVPIIHYATDQMGNMIRPFGYSLKVWRFGETTFEQLRTQNRDLPLDRYDLKVNCTDEQFQKVTFSAVPDSIVHNPQFREAVDPNPQAGGKTYGQQVDGYLAAMAPRLERIVGTLATPQEWGVLIGMPGAGGFDAPVGGVLPDQPVQDIRQLLSGVTS